MDSIGLSKVMGFRPFHKVRLEYGSHLITLEFFFFFSLSLTVLINKTHMYRVQCAVKGGKETGELTVSHG